MRKNVKLRIMTAAVVSAGVLFGMNAPVRAEQQTEIAVSAGITEEGSEGSITGWQTEDGKTYYYDEDGNPVTGWQDIGEERYYFDETGVMQTGLLHIDGKLYYFRKNGTMKPGWTHVDDKWYYMTATGEAVTGWKQIGDYWYYFSRDGVRTGGWLKWKDRWYYFTSDGRMKTGWLSWKGQWYYFASNGAMRTGWLKDNNKWYYLGQNGAMKTGWLNWKDHWYYFFDGGAMKTGWLKWKNEWYYFSGSGSMKTGWVQDGEDWYYMNSDGTMCYDRMIIYKNTYYCLLKSGVMRELPDQLAAMLAYSMKGDLKEAFKYASGTKYYGRDEFDASWGSEKLAQYGITNRKGNCYVYAATFRDLAYAMGYDVHQISGYVKVVSGKARHSWVEIDLDGKTYVYDPAYARRFDDIYYCYQFDYGKKDTYIYVDFERMN